MKKILFIILSIGSIFLISDKVNAAVVGINTLSYDIYQNSNLVSQGSIDTQSGLSINNVTYYNIHNPSTSNSVDIKGVNANGSYFIFYVRLYPSSESLSSNVITTINGYVRDNYSNVYNCNVNTFMVSDQKNTDLSYFSFTCDLTSLGDKQIYSFGFNYNSLTKIDDFRISNFYFYNAQSGESGVIGSINNSTQDIINNQNQMASGIIGGANKNTQDIINNQTNMANGIISGANQNKNDIIDNQDKNTQDVIDNANANHQEAENTRKGIFGTLKSVLESIINLPTKLVTLLIEALTNLLKSLFIPGDDFLNNWFNDLKGGFEKQLGFLSYPITWILEILNKFLTLNDTGHYIISWSAIKVPNFDFNIIESGTFDLAILLQDSTIKAFHDTYLVIIDALMLLAFMNLCMNVYNRIFGGEVDNYEYISVDEGYNIDVSTGEVTSQWTRQRRTRKERVV